MSKLIFAVTNAAAAAFVVVSIFSAGAEAQTTDNDRYCAHLAGFAEVVAETRDSGVPLHEVITEAAKERRAGLRQDYLFVVQLVYEDPHLAPSQEAYGIFRACGEALNDDRDPQLTSLEVAE